MAEDDIYNNQRRYDAVKENIESILVPLDKRSQPNHRDKYYCKNPKNLQYFKKLFIHFEAKDLSYIRRLRTICCLKLICHVTTKDLKECEREDINEIVAYMHSRYKSPQSKTDFIKNLKKLWRVLFPEKDERGRSDETIVPYPVRHLSIKIDKSKEKLRNDRLTWEEFEKLLNYFNEDARMQAYLFLALESLGRPQEILYTKIKDVEIYDNYAKVFISEHGKEGTGFLQCIDSYPYVSKWFDQHPLKYNQNAYFFLNQGRKGRYEQFKPKNVNLIIKKACKKLEIAKNITCYSLKRNGVTFRRLRGDSDVEIQHAARWTSTKQLKTYDMSRQEDAFKMELIKRGIIDTKDPKYNNLKPKIKTCLYCKKSNALTSEFCIQCQRPLDREKILEKEKHFEYMQKELETIKNQQQNIEVLTKFFENKEMQDLLKMFHKIQELKQTA